MTYNWTQDQQELFLDRYALKDENGKPVEDTPEQMWDRVATAIGDSDEERKRFRLLLDSFKFVPGGRILAGAGAESEKTFYNCYVIPVETKARRENRKPASTISIGSDLGEYEFRIPPIAEDAGSDSRAAIFDTIATMVDIMSRGGGVGINWSVLRPTGSYLNRISGTSSGSVGWMDVASAAVGEVEQGGSRRGAAMFMLNDWHPDVLRFINAKREKGKITNANVSVAVSDRFMAAVSADDEWHFRFPDTTDPNYNVQWDGDIEGWERGGGRVKDHGVARARDVWTAITESAHNSGEPGIVFLDRYNAESTAGSVERIISVNPCGEQGLGAYSVCNLGAMNLEAYVTTPAEGSVFDFGSFRRDVVTAIRFLDNCIDKNYYFLPETEDQQERLRRIGLGVMGLADALIRLGIRYGSPEAVSFTAQVFQQMKDVSIRSSQEIAGRKGWAKGWSESMNDRPFLKEYYDRTGEQPFPLRNLFLLTQAPTGTTSLLAGVNSGIEPFFNFAYQREDRIGKRWIVPESIKATDIDVTADGFGMPDYLVNSRMVTVEEHIAMQAAVQKYVDSSVSKTINAPNDQTPEDTAKAYELAWKSGLKGLAYYRDGSRSIQVLYHEDPNEKIAALEEKIASLEAKIAFKELDRSVGGFSGWNDATGFAPLNFTSGHSATCSGQIVFEEGCQKCYTCSWTAC